MLMILKFEIPQILHIMRTQITNQRSMTTVAQSNSDERFFIRMTGRQDKTLLITVSGYILPFAAGNYFPNNWLKADISMFSTESHSRIISLELLQVEEFINLGNWIDSTLSVIQDGDEETFKFVDPSLSVRIRKKERENPLLVFYLMSCRNDITSMWVWYLDLNPDALGNFKNQVYLLSTLNR